MLDKEVFLAKLRNIIQQDNWPIPFSEWKNTRDTNCLAFALGLDISDPDFHRFFGDFAKIAGMESKLVGKDIPKSVLSEIFVETCNVLGLNCRPIANLNEVNINEYVLGVFGFYPSLSYSRSTCTHDVYSYDFHVIRRNLDGTWVNKPSFGSEYKPKEIEWKVFKLFYPEEPLYFAVAK